MGSIKHSKYKNTGILFELCVRQITTDLLHNKDSKAVKILRKYFTNTELGNEYALYSAVVNSQKLNETKSEVLLSTIIEQHRKLDKQKINKHRYNLIKEIKSNYDIEDFFKAKINNYKVHAAIYTIFESDCQPKVTNTQQIVDNKMVIFEHLNGERVENSDKKYESIIGDLLKEDKEIRLLTYKLLVKKFNDKYSSLSERQKAVLKEYIYNITDTVKLKKFVNEELSFVKKELLEIASSTKDPVVKIKIKEVVKFINPLRENETIKDELITGILQYHQLINELKTK
jgi:hypothetical protein